MEDVMGTRPYGCGLEAALDVIGGKWKVLILWQSRAQSRRFGELKRLVPGISEKMLIQQLRQMEADGIVRRKVYHEVPPKVEYSLTAFGVSLQETLAPLCEWGSRHMTRIAMKHQQSGLAASGQEDDTPVTS
jgi:DNA-binding HxlR family transcriptional regulator